MTELYYYGDLTKRQQRNVDRNRSRENAGGTNVSDKKYMSNLGKEGIKRQQEHMISKGADVESDYQASEYLKSLKKKKLGKGKAKSSKSAAKKKSSKKRS